MSYLALHSRDAETRLSGREVRHIAALAEDALAGDLAMHAHWQLRADLGLPAADSGSFASQLSWLMSDGETHRVQGHDVYLIDLALNALYRQQPAAGVLCWLYGHALGHGWVADGDRHAFAAEIQAALDAGAARPGLGWEVIIGFLRERPGGVATSLSIGRGFPDDLLALDANTWSPRLRHPQDSGGELDASWDRLGPAGQWERCIQALRSWPARQWHPGGGGNVFGEFTIQPGSGLTRAHRGPRGASETT